MDYVNNKQKKTRSIENSINFDQGYSINPITGNIDDNQQWRGPCQIDQREKLIKHERQPYLSYKVHIFNIIFHFYYIIFQDSW